MTCKKFRQPSRESAERAPHHLEADRRTYESCDEALILFVPPLALGARRACLGVPPPPQPLLPPQIQLSISFWQPRLSGKLAPAQEADFDVAGVSVGMNEIVHQRLRGKAGLIFGISQREGTPWS
jgi:hypothetical protein